MNPLKILIIGNRGQLGWALACKAEKIGIGFRGADLPDFDMTNEDSVYRMVEQDRYSAVINAAAYTAVDKAEQDANAAFAVNRDGAAHLADACRRKKIPMIHISTDYVFNGKGTVPYQVNDLVDPLGIYGQSKAAGEKAVRERLNQHIIIRTSWLYGIHGNNFIKTMLRLAKEKKELRVVDDQQGCPTFADDLADAIIRIVMRLPGMGDQSWGTYHYCNAGITTWYQFAQKAIELASRYDKFTVDSVIPIATSDYPTLAQRPVFSALDCKNIKLTFDIDMISWEVSLEKMISALYCK